MPRILCLLVPLFGLAARLRAEPELQDEAVAICDGHNGGARITAASRRARRAGVRPGLTLAQARALLPGLIARGHDAAAEAAAQEALIEAAGSVSPQVEDAGGGVVYAAVAGMERLFPGPTGEADLATVAVRAADRMGLPAWAGVASSKLAARVAARRPHGPTVVPPGGEAAFLAALPLSDLEPDPETLRTLHLWGLRRIGELAALPPRDVAARLGEPGRRLHQAACGVDPQPLVPAAPPDVLQEGLELEWAATALEPFLAAAAGALERLARRLERHGAGCVLLELELVLEPEGIQQRLVRLPAPTREVATLLDLIRLELERSPPGAAVAAFTCRAHPGQPRQAQLTLFGAPQLSPDRLAATLARLAARLGPERVASPRASDGHRPERWHDVPFDPPPPPKVRRPPRRGRGLLAVRTLRPPVPLEVILTPEGQAPGTSAPGGDGVAEPAAAGYGAVGRPPGAYPASLRSLPEGTPRVQGLVRVAAGPWALEEGWWRDDPVARQYWDVELSGGGLYRIFRAPDGEWYADGVYD